MLATIIAVVKHTNQNARESTLSAPMARRVVAALCVAAAWALLPTTKRTRNLSLLSAKTVWTFEEAREYARSFGFGSQAEYIEYRCPGAYALPRDPVAAFGDRWTSWPDYLGLVEVVTRPGFEQVLFVEMGWGADQHGQNATKACVRAARNAIEFSTVWKSTSELGHPENCGESPP